MYMKGKRDIWVFLFLFLLSCLTACRPTTVLPASLNPVSAAASLPMLVRGPYLQAVTDASIIIVWETDRASHGEVVYGETAEYGMRVTDPTVGTRHAITITDLAPYTVYHYRVASDGVSLSADTTFHTAAGPDQTEFTFAVFGDTHAVFGDAQTQNQIHQTAVERIIELEPDFVLHVGDLVDRGSDMSHWETFFEIERELMAHIPLFPTLGNHEHGHANYFNLFYLPGNERWYAFDYGNARFLCLQIDGYADFDPQSEQYIWLEETLAANTQPWLFVYFHIPPYTSSWEIPNLEHVVRESLAPLFEQYGVAVVLAGHHHNYERNEVHGVTYIVTGGGGARHWVMGENEPTQAAFAVEHHVVLLEIDGDHLKGTVLSNEGQVLDEFER